MTVHYFKICSRERKGDMPQSRITCESFQSIVEPVVDKILEVFQPNAVVLQRGVNFLSGDKVDCLNLTIRGLAHCVQYLRKKNVLLILLSGGGYTVMNAARTWTYETACALGIEDIIDPNLPWNEYFEWFGPRYRLEVVASNMEDMNVKDGSLEQVRINALKHLRKLNSAPSAGMRDVPKENLRPRRRREQRMSLLTGPYFDVAHNHQSRRKFFQRRVVFDDTWQRVKLVQGLGLGFGVSDLAGIMERGGGGEDDWIETDTVMVLSDMGSRDERPYHLM
ncbi:hypothetical protein EDD18DRAFT_1334878 [Armillaria luteobubalina]|uniref:Histone deacetylase domain-containing protein n=1 Tax=Armillaria luteobubalina TaxID=153913 RepID=A0AA39PSN3_9AGAR|nr:hypothetical protein EDD18DRAFT_1334878 [Armillaria luteobubalina]